MITIEDATAKDVERMCGGDEGNRKGRNARENGEAEEGWPSEW